MPATLTVNTDLLDQTLSYLEANPGRRDETIYHCRPAACFACHILLQHDPDALTGSLWTETAGVDGIRVTELVRYQGQLVPIPMAAAGLLGITEQQAGLLFAADNTFDDLRNIIATVKGDR